jgi:glycerol-1-phosphate dehydrogenase [NAD(P)+]
MPSQAEPIDPTDVERINQRVRAWASPDETVHPVRTRQVLIEQDALDGLTDEVRTRAPGGRVLLVVDRTPIKRGGEDLKALIEDRLARTGPLEIRRLPDEAGGSFHADLETAGQLAAELSHYAAVVSVGSGSITDVAKYARHLHVEQTGRDLPFVCFPTAASVTAYTSALAVLSIDGVKRTLPARAPDAVVCDLQTLADAPPIMTQAGFGDVLARSVSYGDWFLAHQLGMDEGFSQVPARLLETAERRMIESAERIAACELDGIRVLTDAVLLAGMAMSLVNQTAPVSGWEHVISHCLDLTAAGDGRRPALHGGQVGVATLVSARAYERAWGNLDLDRLLSDASAAHADHTIESAFGKHDPTGKLTAEVRRDYARKLTRWNAALPARRIFVDRARAGEFDEFLQENVRTSAQVADALRRARAPQRFADLDQPVPESTAFHTIQNAHLIRARFTFGDLLAQTGWLTDGSAAALMCELP